MCSSDLEFYSNAFSHGVPDSGAARAQMLAHRSQALSVPLERYVVQRAPAMAHTLQQYAGMLGLPGWRVFRYEDVVFDKRRWLSDICSHFGWPDDEGFAGLVLSWADIRPQDEDPTRFVRQVTPGDHRLKLGPQAIAQLNQSLAGALERFGYAAR